MLELIGTRGTEALLSDGTAAVVVDVATNTVLSTSSDVAELSASADWETDLSPVPDTVFELAAATLADLNIKVVTASGRLYTVPRAMAEHAARALSQNIHGTPALRAVARQLSTSSQIDLASVRLIANCFSSGKAEEYGASGLVGGPSAKKWVDGIVSRDGRAMTADGLEPYGHPVVSGPDISDFDRAYDDAPVAPEFIARIRLDGSGIDRLYKIDPDNRCYVWDGSGWDDLARPGSTIWDYDAALDWNDDEVGKSHVPVDPDSAIVLAARFTSGYSPVTIEQIDWDEAALFSDALPEIDWDMVDYTMVAAGEPPISDGQYTQDERSENASKQVRDGNGRFAAQGSRVVVGGDVQNGVGNITAIDPRTQSVTVELDNGNTVTVPAATTERAENYASRMTADAVDAATPEAYSTTGIFGESRDEAQPSATLPQELPQAGDEDVKRIFAEYQAWAQRARDKRVPFDRAEDPKLPKQAKTWLESVGGDITVDAYKHPLLKDFLNKKVKKNGKTVHPNRLWYQPVTSAATPAKETPLTPETSDVQPLFAAIVSADDPRAVLELISIVPATDKSASPAVFKRRNNKWMPDDGILAELNSATPPPVVPLDADSLRAVLDQVDKTSEATPQVASITREQAMMIVWGPRMSLVAAADKWIHATEFAGGADRNRGNAEKLRRYWLYGRGALKIRWNTPGDWTRCVRYLSKYMGPRAKGYCALRHKEATGMWTGDKMHRRETSTMSASTADIAETDAVIERAALAAAAAEVKSRVLTASADEMLPPGARFLIPLVIPEGVESGDGRIFDKEAISIRELPLPLLWQIKTADGHSGSVVVGRIDHMERLADGGIGNAYGQFDSGPYGKEAERLVREGFIRGVSADLDQFEAEDGTELQTDEDGKEIEVKNDKLRITKARVMAATIVPKPAFQECTIVLEADEQPMIDQEEEVIPDGIYVEDVDPIEAAALVACGFVAGAIPTIPPREWFDDPQLEKATPLTVTDDGRVFGHIAAWNVDHIGMTFGTRPPRSRSKYAYFHTGVLRTEDGTDVPVGQLTLAGGHASLELSATQAARHYDDTASAIADVHAGEDAYGIWVAGSLRPGASPEQIRALRASAPSGDWRPIKGQLELVAVCQVNVPGFPIARARVASGQVMALVAAGASTLAKMKSDPVNELAVRLENIERELAKEKLGTLSSRSITAARNESLRNKAAALSARVKLGSEAAEAMPGKSEAAEPFRVVKYTPETQPRDAQGKFREVLARLKQDLGVSGSQDAIDKIVETENFDSAGDYVEAAKSATDVIEIVDRIDAGAINPDALQSIRMAAGELGKAIANLPLPFGSDTEKVRYSDLPPAMRDLIETMMTKVLDKIGPDDAGPALAPIESFKSGSDLYSQSEIQAEMSKMLRLLT